MMACQPRRSYLPSTLLLLSLAAFRRMLQTRRPSDDSRAMGSRQNSHTSCHFRDDTGLHQPQGFLYALETPA